MRICPEVGGLMSPTAVRNVDLPAPLGPKQRHDLAAANADRSVAHGDHLRVAGAVDFRKPSGFDGQALVHRTSHPINASFGSTRIAFQMPRKLESTEIPSTMAASCSKSSLVRTTRRGKYGNSFCPTRYAIP